MTMLGMLLRLAVFRMLPRRLLPVLLLYDVFRMFRRRAVDHRTGRERELTTGESTTTGRSSGGRW